jgi:hypothetical protein
MFIKSPDAATTACVCYRRARSTYRQPPTSLREAQEKPRTPVRGKEARPVLRRLAPGGMGCLSLKGRRLGGAPHSRELVPGQRAPLVQSHLHIAPIFSTAPSESCSRCTLAMTALVAHRRKGDARGLRAVAPIAKLLRAHAVCPALISLLDWAPIAVRLGGGRRK